MQPQELKNERIVFVVLDWGLGHASRSARLIEILKLNNELTLLSSGSAFVFLRDYFPDLEVNEITQKKISYAERGPLWLHLLWQYPKIKNLVKVSEVEAVYQQFNATQLISDNVYLKSNMMHHLAIITHQLSIPTPWNTFKAMPTNWLKHWKYIWIPDDMEYKLAGELSHHPKLKGSFIGWLSTWKKSEAAFEYDLGVICSGPEIHKKDMFLQYHECIEKIEKAWMVNVPSDEQNEVLGIYGAINPEQLSERVQKTKKIIIRGGYSTLMDLMAVDYKGEVEFHPHQGQLEQKYLQKLWETRNFECHLT